MTGYRFSVESNIVRYFYSLRTELGRESPDHFYPRKLFFNHRWIFHFSPRFRTSFPFSSKAQRMDSWLNLSRSYIFMQSLQLNRPCKVTKHLRSSREGSVSLSANNVSTYTASQIDITRVT